MYSITKEQNENVDINTQLDDQQKQQSKSDLTPEQEEEMKLRSKYPNAQKPGGSAFIQKMLHKGHKKYFDSGDYNMAKSRNKVSILPAAVPTPTSQNNCTQTPINKDKQIQIETKCTIESGKISDELSTATSPCIINQPNAPLPPLNQHNNQNTNNKLMSTPCDNILVDNLDDELIGHEIPTPESLPTRKHSIVQSKLVTES